MNSAALLTNLEWRQPLWLVLAAQPLVIMLIRYLLTRHAPSFVDQHLRPWVIRQPKQGKTGWLFSRNNIYFLAWILFAVAAAGPRVPLDVPGDELRDGTDTMVVLDLSRSMTANDVEPNRIKRARIELHQLLRRLLPGDRVGLIVYAGRPHVLTPLTYDKNALSYYLNTIHTRLLPTEGSNMEAALALAREQLSTSGRTAKAVLLVTDGATRAEHAASQDKSAQTLAALKQDGTPVYVLGVGTVEGASIALAEGGWLNYEGRAVVTHLDEHYLRRLAQTGNGNYANVSDDDYDWSVLYDQGIATLAPHTIETKNTGRVKWREYYPWALVPAVLLLFWIFNPVRLGKQNHQHNFTALYLLPILAIALAPSDYVQAADNPVHVQRNAFAAYQAGDYPAARVLYEQLPGYAGRFGEGVSAYRSGDIPLAIRQFSEAVLVAHNDAERSKALHNLGNSYFQLGDYLFATEVYRDALLYQPDSTGAKKNLQFAQLLLNAVSDRLVELAKRRRGGRGPQQRILKDQTIENESLAVDETEQQKRPPTELPRLPETNTTDIADLVTRGLQYAQQTGQVEITASGQIKWQQHAPSAVIARSQMMMIDEHPAQLWKRLFEMEEGFPAPLEEPRNLPGVLPW
jgi:Ca-activated chloride channel family protein